MRQDIQFLRGYAVSIVILAHAGVGPTAGYLGVDIFFVISGFLITRMIQTQIFEGRFSFTEFYSRRAKRLIPAAYATVAMTAAAAYFFLGSVELAEFQKQIFGAITFTANFVLLSQSGYFDGAAELKPLLHIWSLAIEEQYYLLLPALLLLIPSRFWNILVTTLLLVSVAICAYWLSVEPDRAFYLLPSRAWELLIGSVVALTKLDKIQLPRVFRLAFWPAMGALCIIPFIPTEFPHPSLDALLVWLSTAIVIINQRSFFGRLWPTQAVARIGDVSYSLYLTHWPVIAFANNAYLGELDTTLRLSLIIVGAKPPGGEGLRA